MNGVSLYPDLLWDPTHVHCQVHVMDSSVRASIESDHSQTPRLASSPWQTDGTSPEGELHRAWLEKTNASLSISMKEPMKIE